jgi:hypothetical protein
LRKTRNERYADNPEMDEWDVGFQNWLSEEDAQVFINDDDFEVIV